ncbi:conserved hypothetical protein [Ricinus communis]|uniref:Uncharacterized protein n=1 Tax=Ricinus communis TaxID=3988 RepID=B9SE99_RICCO|nr:conserved hypothetical protein [Ricinus communis]
MANQNLEKMGMMNYTLKMMEKMILLFVMVANQILHRLCRCNLKKTILFFLGMTFLVDDFLFFSETSP